MTNQEITDALANMMAVAENMREKLEMSGHEVPNGHFNQAYMAIESLCGHFNVGQ